MHSRFILKDHKETVAQRLAGDALANLMDVVPDHLAAVFVFFLVSVFLHLPHIVRRVGRQRPGLKLHTVRRDFQIGREGRDDVLPVRGRFQVDVDRQHLDDLDEAVVVRDHHTVDDISDRQPCLGAARVLADHNGVVLDAFAEKKLLQAHLLFTSPR